ncbi:hypothetical protein VNO78_22248 [Psophocarpus tetragonolobus]|uniref:malate dehydrogenase n=2 Tax=NPAAA clade TaxID=2231382 RepID=A0AAN9XIR1_PSOTE
MGATRVVLGVGVVLGRITNNGAGIQSVLLSSRISGDALVGGGKGTKNAKLSTLERQEVQMKKAKLINMFNELLHVALPLAIITVSSKQVVCFGMFSLQLRKLQYSPKTASSRTLPRMPAFWSTEEATYNVWLIACLIQIVRWCGPHHSTGLGLGIVEHLSRICFLRYLFITVKLFHRSYITLAGFKLFFLLTVEVKPFKAASFHEVQRGNTIFTKINTQVQPHFITHTYTLLSLSLFFFFLASNLFVPSILFISSKMAKDPVRVLVTGAAGQIGYALVPMIARGVMLGPDQPVILHMLDIPPAAESLNGVKMELVDAAFPLLKGVVATTDVVEACTGVNIAVMVGGFPRKEGMERKDVMSKNVSIYKSQASALEKHAAANCKVLVVANPANTNALILKEFAPSIPEKNISCLTRLDHNRALGQISERLSVQVSDVKNVIIWGNHSSTQYPDVNHATVTTTAGEKSVRELVTDDAWLNGEFITTVQQRGAAIIKARKLSSALSAASAACDHIRDWVLGTPQGTWVSMGVYSDGSYNVPAGLIYSFPVTCANGEWTIVQGLSIDDFSRKKLDLTAEELSEEKALAYSCLN